MGGRDGAGGTIGRSFCSHVYGLVLVQARTSWVWHGTHSNTARIAVAMHRGALSRACQPPQSAAYGRPGGQTRFCNLSCAGTLSLSRRRPAIQPCRWTKRQLPAVVARSGPAQRPFDIAEQQRSVFTDQSGEPALNLDIICLEIAGLIVRVFRLQTNAARLFQQGFQRGFLLLDQCDNNVAMIGRA